jgi:uncharacterized protein (TIRG00374 family)
MAESGRAVFSKRFYLFLGLGVAVFLGLSFYGNRRAVGQAFRGFAYAYLPLILFLAFMNYLTRFLRWEIYLRHIGVKVPRRESFRVFMSGLLMTVTPGKMGELLKSYLLKERHGIPVSRSGPVVLAERFTDLLAVYLLTLLGGVSFAIGSRLMWLGLFVLAVVWAPLVYPPLFYSALRRLRAFSLGRRLERPLTDAFHTLHDLMGIRLLVVATLLAAAAWFFECLAFQWVFFGLGTEMGLFPAVFIYAFSTLAGALSMLPGGIGAAEGSMTSLLLWLKVPKAQAATATIIIRVCTVWFAVFLGYLFLRGIGRKDLHEH